MIKITFTDKKNEPEHFICLNAKGFKYVTRHIRNRLTSTYSIVSTVDSCYKYLASQPKVTIEVLSYTLEDLVDKHPGLSGNDYKVSLDFHKEISKLQPKWPECDYGLFAFVTNANTSSFKRGTEVKLLAPEEYFSSPRTDLIRAFGKDSRGTYTEQWLSVGEYMTIPKVSQELQQALKFRVKPNDAGDEWTPSKGEEVYILVHSEDESSSWDIRLERFKGDRADYEWFDEGNIFRTANEALTEADKRNSEEASKATEIIPAKPMTDLPHSNQYFWFANINTGKVTKHRYYVEAGIMPELQAGLVFEYTASGKKGAEIRAKQGLLPIYTPALCFKTHPKKGIKCYFFMVGKVSEIIWVGDELCLSLFESGNCFPYSIEGYIGAYLYGKDHVVENPCSEVPLGF